MTVKLPTVTVIIPTYNSSGTLKLSLETVLRQDFSDYEVWVIGDCCTDDSEAVVASFGDDHLHWVNLPVNSGSPSAPRNEGLLRARGRFIAYLGHDDIWFPWHLSELMDCIERSNSDFVYSLGAILGPDGVVGTFSLPESAWNSQWMSPSNWLHRKSLTEVIGRWSPKIKYADDRDFYQRILHANMRIGFRRQLTVLKYPAGLWRMYSLNSNYPQSKQVEDMINSAELLRLELLLESAAVLSRQRVLLHRHVNRLLKPLRAVIRSAFDLYGRQRWPVKNFVKNLSYYRWRRDSGLAEKQRNVSKK